MQSGSIDSCSHLRWRSKSRSKSGSNQIDQNGDMPFISWGGLHDACSDLMLFLVACCHGPLTSLVDTSLWWHGYFFPCVLLWLHMFLLGDDFSNHSQNLPFPSTVYLEAWVPAHYNFPRSKFLDICRHSRTISKHFFLSTTIGQYVLVQVTLQLVADLCSLYFQTHYIILSYTTHNRDSGSDCKNCISDRKKWCKLK